MGLSNGPEVVWTAVKFKRTDVYISATKNQAQTLIERTLLKQKNHFV